MAPSASQKVPVYSINDLKSTTDDAIAPYLTSLPSPFTFTQDHTKTNVRFVLGYTAVTIAAFTFYADRKLGWEATQSSWVIAAVATYFVLNTVLTLWVWCVEAGEVFYGRMKSGETISIRSSIKRHTPFYSIHVLYKDASGKLLQEKQVQGTFTAWFTGNGIFHREQFQQWLTSEIEILKHTTEKKDRKEGRKTNE